MDQKNETETGQVSSQDQTVQARHIQGLNLALLTPLLALGSSVPRARLAHVSHTKTAQRPPSQGAFE